MTRKNITCILCLTGLMVAVISALEPYIPSITSLCGYFGDGCQDARTYALFNIPVAWLGIFFYALVCLGLFLRPRSAFLLVMAGLGFELKLAAIMVDQQFFCLFCILNLLVIAGLTLAVIKRAFFWQSATITLFCLILSHLLFSFDGAGPGTLSGQTSQGNDSKDKMVVAYLAETPIYHKDLEKKIAGRLYSLRHKIYKQKRIQLEAIVQERIIALEAQAKGITVQELKRRINNSAPKVAEKDVIQYYLNNQQALSRNKEIPDVLMQKVRQYLISQTQLETMQAYILPLMKRYNFQDLFPPPKLPLAQVRIDNNFATGPENAAVTIVEFSDYLCPMCRKAHDITREIRQKYQEKIRWIFKDYPLKMHKGAKYLAMAARCAGEQGKFWEFQDLLFGSKTKNPGRKEMLEFARHLDLDLDLFTQSLDTGKFMPDVDQDLRDVPSAGVNATPTFIINGRLHPGVPSPEEFSTMIDKELSGSTD